MTTNLSGSWTGEMSGTNSGGMMLELTHEGDRLYGMGRFCELSLGAYEYAIQGVAKTEKFVLFLTPKAGQNFRLGTIQAECQSVGPNDLEGKWSSSIGTAGIFKATRAKVTVTKSKPAANSVFLVHGHDEATKEKVARFLEKIGLDVIILHEKVNQGMTIIEKFEEYAAQASPLFSSLQMT